MPWQPLRRCTAPGCNRRVAAGKCDEHRREAWRAEDARRGHRRARGYTAEWDKYRLLFLSHHPLCAECEREGVISPAVIVDHIIPIAGGHDVLFWPGWNHQALCLSHHSRKTTRIDPITKADRKAGRYRAEEARAAARRGWGDVQDET